MSELISSVLAAPHWIFIALGGILLIFELLGTGGYALWSGISAVIVGIIAWLLPMLSWTILWLLFAIFTLVTAYLWWVWLRKKNQDKSSGSELNKPQSELLGFRTIVVEPITNGYGRVKIKDGTWSATCQEDLPVGTKVNVIGVNGLILTVEKQA